MAGSLLNLITWIKLEIYSARLTFLKAVYYVICYGPIPVEMSKGGESVIGEFHIRLVPIKLRNFFKNMILTLFVGRIRFEFELCAFLVDCLSTLLNFGLNGRRFFQVIEDGYEFFADRQLVTIFSAPNYCGEFDNAGAMMSVDESLMCSFQILRPADKKPKFGFGSTTTAKQGTPLTKTKVVFVSQLTILCSTTIQIIKVMHTLHILYVIHQESLLFNDFLKTIRSITLR